MFVILHIFLLILFCAIQLTFCEWEWKSSQSLDQITVCLALQQLAGHGAPLWLAAHFGVLDIRLLGNTLHFEKITSRVKYFILDLANRNYTLHFLRGHKCGLCYSNDTFSTLASSVGGHTCSFPAAAHCFVFTRPRTLTPRICRQSNTVRHY